MKKALIIYLALLFGLFVVLFALDRKGDYIVEKKTWELYRKHIDIAKDPVVIPDRAFEDIIAGYTNIISQYPDSRLAPELHIRLGGVYMLRKDYEAARKSFHEVITLYPDNKELSAQAMFKVGETYELDDNWVKASQTYTSIIKDYPETDTALSVPIYIATYYRGRNNFQKTMEAYEIAIRYYKRTAADYEDTKMGLSALRYLSNCYLEQNRWNEAIDTLGAILEKYASSGHMAVKDLDMAIKTINIISAYELKDYDIAVSLYQGIIDRQPGRPLNTYLEKVIDAFKQLREKGIEAADLNK